MEIQDGNGGSTGAFLIPSPSSRVKTWIQIFGVLVGIAIAIGGIVFGAVRIGVETEVHEGIEEELRAPNGAIHRHVEICVREQSHEVEKRIRDEIDEVENNVIELTTEQRSLKRQLEVQHQELIREIRRNGSGGG